MEKESQSGKGMYIQPPDGAYQCSSCHHMFDSNNEPFPYIIIPPNPNSEIISSSKSLLDLHLQQGTNCFPINNLTPLLPDMVYLTNPIPTNNTALPLPKGKEVVVEAREPSPPAPSSSAATSVGGSKRCTGKESATEEYSKRLCPSRKEDQKKLMASLEAKSTEVFDRSVPAATLVAGCLTDKQWEVCQNNGPRGCLRDIGSAVAMAATTVALGLDALEEFVEEKKVLEKKLAELEVQRETFEIKNTKLEESCQLQAEVANRNLTDKIKAEKKWLEAIEDKDKLNEELAVEIATKESLKTRVDNLEKELAEAKEVQKKAFDKGYQAQLYRLFLCYPNSNWALFGDTAVEDVARWIGNDECIATQVAMQKEIAEKYPAA